MLVRKTRQKSGVIPDKCKIGTMVVWMYNRNVALRLKKLQKLPENWVISFYLTLPYRKSNLKFFVSVESITDGILVSEIYNLYNIIFLLKSFYQGFLFLLL